MIFLFLTVKHPRESMIISIKKMADIYICNFLVVEYDENHIVKQFFLWNGRGKLAKEIIEVLDKVK